MAQQDNLEHQSLLRPESHQADFPGYHPQHEAFQSRGFIGLFARHKVAANLLMLIMILAGVIALLKLNVQFFPNFELDYATVRVVWPAASAEDVEASITEPVERVLRNLDNLDEMTSTSSLGVSVVSLKFNEGTNMIEALDQISQRVGELRNLPQDAEKPMVERIVRYEPIARVLLIGEQATLDELRPLARRFERELLDAGIDKVDLKGLPLEEMAVEVSQNQLESLGLSFDEIGNKLANMSRDLPMGTVGDAENSQDMRSIQQGRNEQDFANLTIKVTETEKVSLADMAHIERRAKKDAPKLYVDGHPTIEMQLMRSEAGDTLKSSEIMQNWLAKTQPELPGGVRFQVYNETWSLVNQRIMLLINNGISGLILVVLILYLFMHGRVAFWVAVGIPVSFMATLMIMYLAGGSINMISLFGLIMALGIIVDDAIVVGEDTLAHHEMGEPALQAAEGGAHRMLAPVTASSITTIGAFLPLMMIGNEMGNILFAIPLVIISVIFASLIESFVILPGHLRIALKTVKPVEPGSLRYRLDKVIDHWRHVQFRGAVRWVLAHRAIAISSTVAAMIVAIGLLAGGRLAFVFFPSPESTRLLAEARFVAGTPSEVSSRYVNHLYQAMRETEQALEPGIVEVAVVHYNEGTREQGASFSSINIELAEPDERETRNEAFIRMWHEKAGQVPGLDVLTIEAPRMGPPGSDIDVRIWGAEPRALKEAALALQEVLMQVPGVSGVRDDLPFGRDQLIYELTPEGEVLGFTYTALARQLSDAYSGRLVQIFTDKEDEVEVRLQLPRSEQATLASLSRMQVVSPSGVRVPLSSVAKWESQRGFDIMRHVDGRLAVTVIGEVDKSVNNANRILDQLKATTLKSLVEQYGIQYSLEGQNARQVDTLADMKIGLFIGLSIIYIVLAWVFASYSWPLVVMMAIPFGLVGALMGHWVLNIDMTILSLFGFFGLAGIVVNDSIILVSFYKRLREEGMAVNQALEEASVQRVRAVLLTSLTTIAGLLPLLFETSLQAQFLIPMAVSIAFGLAFSTVLILLVIPAVLSVYEIWRHGEAETVESK
ncbi:MAG: acriflavin resistance protein [Piscirickettsiaceae bacterium CG_4_9_14_3_um_filter_43_564]|nr:efflux RND transporter permease subunit [Thiomicrospira sp.]PIQ02705.1 MAG: acriflavin resistance protein [Piscirickettsiaceae bacterium CG18_big_fil_WC_8_21_14_2_50_44_103]PIU38847.1 MAG: acriflavin resistance protein [Piscirickettsiaceae bacterium CG07_land_8_20_14_0_80_44_28]PIW58024.1 MAG: acriflavin resistance protein [Piscirickettsiaceae bacterium CG12_big_fil_rev_8_21_14_0_65_44_934]PIW78018.1 MAG: acriflavin resistance protein [Piscirickettsiaceae bacterium CG_4_8_14_3_um_filter_44_3